MYTEFFNLKEAPFSIAPDPRYLFMTEGHREALAHLLYGINSGGGVVLLTGEIGAGKTTVCRCFLEQVPSSCNVAYIFNPKLTVRELLQSLCEEFSVPVASEGVDARGLKPYIDALTAHLLQSHAQQRTNVLIIDEAQNLSPDVLEQLRLLTNLETSERKLLQIILIGQPELRDILAQPRLEQLAQRVIARFHLQALNPQEMASYIRYRLGVAGLKSASAIPFPPRLLRRMHEMTRGVPRRINLLCDRALLGAYAEGKPEVDVAILERAGREVFAAGTRTAAAAPRSRTSLVLGLAACVIGAGALGLFIDRNGLPALPLSLEGSKLAWFNEPRQTNPAPAGPERQASAGPVSAAPEAAKAPAPASTEPGAAAEPVGAREPEVRSDAAPARIFNEQDGRIVATLPSREETFRQLAGLWNVRLERDQASCPEAVKFGLHCFARDTGFAGLRQIDRPAAIELRDKEGKIHHVLLTGLHDTSATLRAGEISQTVDLGLLARYFTGDFRSFWRAAPTQRELLKPGDQGPDVDWIANQLARIHREPQPPAGRVFGDKLQQQVKAFQLMQGLLVDGIIGPVTTMRINRASGVSEPWLLDRAGTGSSTSADPAAASAAAAPAAPASASASKE